MKPRNTIQRAIQLQNPERYRSRTVKPEKGKGRKERPRSTEATDEQRDDETVGEIRAQVDDAYAAERKRQQVAAGCPCYDDPNLAPFDVRPDCPAHAPTRPLDARLVENRHQGTPGSENGSEGPLRPSNRCEQTFTVDSGVPNVPSARVKRIRIDGNPGTCEACGAQMLRPVQDPRGWIDHDVDCQIVVMLRGEFDPDGRRW